MDHQLRAKVSAEFDETAISPDLIRDEQNFELKRRSQVATQSYSAVPVKDMRRSAGSWLVLRSRSQRGLCLASQLRPGLNLAGRLRWP